jgi:hypothetical protein
MIIAVMVLALGVGILVVSVLGLIKGWDGPLS